MKEDVQRLFSLEGKTAIVTGGMGLLGSRYVQALTDAGARVAIFDITKEQNVIIKHCIGAGTCLACTLDITNINDVRDATRAVIEFFGTPTILVNNAGIGTPPGASVADNGPFEDYPEASWDAMLDSHLKGAFLVSREFVRHAKKFGKGGSIINVSSTYGIVTPDQGVYDYRRKRGEEYYKPVSYSVAKSGMLNFTRWLAEYGAHYGIRVNTLVPGGVYEKQDPEFVREYERRTMLGRMARPNDYNGAVLFLASAASAYMTGSMLVVDGGWTAR